MKKRVILFTLNCLLASLLLVCFVGTVANNQAINNVQPTGSYRDESDGNTTLLLDTGKIVNMRFCSSAVKISSSYAYQTKEGYEIVVLYEGETNLLKLLQPAEDLKYIIVLPVISMAEQLKLPKAPCLFATVDFRGGEEPEVTFYSEDIKNV